VEDADRLTQPVEQPRALQGARRHAGYRVGRFSVRRRSECFERRSCVRRKLTRDRPTAPRESACAAFGHTAPLGPREDSTHARRRESCARVGMLRPKPAGRGPNPGCERSGMTPTRRAGSWGAHARWPAGTARQHPPEEKRPGSQAPGSRAFLPSAPQGALHSFTWSRRAFRPSLGPAECPVLPSFAPRVSRKLVATGPTTPRAPSAPRSLRDRFRLCSPPVVLAGAFSHLKIVPSTASCQEENCGEGVTRRYRTSHVSPARSRRPRSPFPFLSVTARTWSAIWTS